MHNLAWKLILEKVSNFEMERGLTSFVNPYSMLMLKDKPELVQMIGHWHIDGISLLQKINASQKLNLRRYSFDDTSIAPVLFKFATDNNLSVAIIGTKEEFINRAVSVIENKYQIEINYWRNGYFATVNERTACLDYIKNKNYDIVICGMGTPYQEQFLIDLKQIGWGGYGYTCGGYLHQIAKKENYYPRFFDVLNIRWVYRIIDEPKLFGRYFFDYPKFFIQFNKHKK